MGFTGLQFMLLKGGLWPYTYWGYDPTICRGFRTQKTKLHLELFFSGPSCRVFSSVDQRKKTIGDNMQ